MDCKTDHTFLPFDLTHCPECDEELKDEEFDHNVGTDEDYGYFGGDEY